MIEIHPPALEQALDMVERDEITYAETIAALFRLSATRETVTARCRPT